MRGREVDEIELWMVRAIVLMVPGWIWFALAEYLRMRAGVHIAIAWPVAAVATIAWLAIILTPDVRQGFADALEVN